MFIDKRLTLGQASCIALLSQTQFLKELGKRKIPIHYDIEDFKQDLETPPMGSQFSPTKLHWRDWEMMYDVLRGVYVVP